MPTINLQIGSGTTLNASVQPGDIAYYIPANTLVGGFNVNISNAEIVKIGVIMDIIANNTILVCNIAQGTTAPEIGDFIYFSKDREVNESSILGYYGKFRFVNNSKQQAELFTVNCNINISSK